MDMDFDKITMNSELLEYPNKVNTVPYFGCIDLS